MNNDNLSKGVLGILLCLFTVAHATIWYVHPDSALNTIQSGLDSCTDNDIVLVGPGTYHENIVWPNTQGIHLVSESSPEVTIMDGGNTGRVLEIASGVDSTTIIRGFTIQNGNAIKGGGIFCDNSSPSLENVTLACNSANNRGGGINFRNSPNPRLVNITITGNNAGHGGGIYCGNSNPRLENININGNTAGWGGGIYCSYSSSPILTDATICGNTSGVNGGGIFCHNSSPNLTNVIIAGNTAESGDGGGIYCWSNMSLVNVAIINNSATSGGGIFCRQCNPSLSNVTISGNTANEGGGIACEFSNLSLSNVIISGNTANLHGGGVRCINSNPIFDSVNRCNIFLNFAGSGCDLFAVNCNTIDVIVDTFTVLQPDDYFAYPVGNFRFDVLNAKIEQVNQDLYVSPDGSDDNSGLTADDPLLTISYALAKILADSTNPLSIHLSNGIYSPSQTSERFALNCRSHVSLLGENEVSSILDGEEVTGIIFCMNDDNLSISNMTIQNGTTELGGGIYCYNSSPSINNVTITGNTAITTDIYGGAGGGGICCENSNPNLTNVTISENSAFGDGWSCGFGGGIECRNSSPNLTNVIISGNTTDGVGAGMSCDDNSSPHLSNVIISGNAANLYGGGIYNNNSHPSLLNCILWNDNPQEIHVESGSVTATYSAIEDGWPGVGNIDTDPMFVSGPLSDYHLSLGSPCIDTGNPSPQYYDPEDPLNPGYALWPALGTVRNDMGVYGGPGTASWVCIEEFNHLQLTSNALQIDPNPFRYTTNIKYTIRDAGYEMQDILMNIYDATGRLVKSLPLPTSYLSNSTPVVWDGTDQANRQLGSGVYFLTLQARDKIVTEKVLLIK
jgi:predicted outer membrane repeat protein